MRHRNIARYKAADPHQVRLTLIDGGPIRRVKQKPANPTVIVSKRSFSKASVSRMLIPNQVLPMQSDINATTRKIPSFFELSNHVLQPWYIFIPRLSSDPGLS